MSQHLLSVKDLSIRFGANEVVRGVSFDVNCGEVVSIVGESGSGKSVSALSLLKLLPYQTASLPTGSIEFLGQDLFNATETEMRRLRGNEIGMIFQEPMMSLNPLHTVGSQIVEAI